jgi:hypothetical protein
MTVSDDVKEQVKTAMAVGRLQFCGTVASAVVAFIGVLLGPSVAEKPTAVSGSCLKLQQDYSTAVHSSNDKDRERILRVLSTDPQAMYCKITSGEVNDFTDVPIPEPTPHH